MRKALFHCSMLAIVLFAFGGTPRSAHATANCYVDIDATSGWDTGVDWTNAYLSLYTALGNPGCLEIWVAAGVYKPGIAMGDSFKLHPWNAVYGGFNGTETDRGQRNWTANLTILSGDIAGDDIDPNGDGIIADANDIRNDNSHKVVEIDGISGSPATSTTVLDGFTITGGDSHLNGAGGGLLCQGAGAGNGCDPTLRNLTFSGNRSGGGGGAIYNNGQNDGQSSPSLTNIVFTGNRAANGGAMYNDGRFPDGVSSPTLTNVVFAGNTASVSGGALYNAGGSGISSPTLTNVTFSSNRAEDSGGAIYDDGGFGISSPSLTDVTFSGNSALNYGGAMFNMGEGGIASPMLTNVTFVSNSTASGGAIYNDGKAGGLSGPTLTNVTFSLNTALYWGGAIFNDGGSDGDSSPTIRNSTFSLNGAGLNGGAIANLGIGQPEIKNVILWADLAVWDPTTPEIYNAGAIPNISYSVVGASGGSGAGWNTALGTDGGGNLDVNPRLGALRNNGGITQTMALIAGSPAIDAGTNPGCTTTDQRGLPRPIDGNLDGTAICDIGAVEYQGHLFADVPVIGKEWMEPWIDAFYYAGVTTGCAVGPLRYCPENNVTRAEMAVFLLRAKHGAGYVPPPATHTFYDVPVAGKEWMEPWIDEFYAEGITTGCGVSPLRYCPEQNVTRAEMAVFVLRAIHTLPYTPPPATHIFYDVPVVGKEWMEPWIEDFYSHGITTGCGTSPLRYCPENNTTRAEMAVFIDRAYAIYQ